MKLRVVGDDGYVILDQLDRGGITVKASASAKIVVGEIVTRLNGIWTGDIHANWEVHPNCAVALFNALYELSERAVDKRLA